MDTNYFIHPNDAKALHALKAVPGFTLLSKKYSEIFIERGVKITNLSSKLRLSPTQLPEIYNLLPPICAKLEIPVPELYLEQNPYINAYTTGDVNPCIVINSGLVNNCTPDVISAILAHECGHIVCHHVAYKSMAKFFLGIGSSLLNVPFLTFALKYALLYWDRCSEYSADRASAFVCGGPDAVVKTMTQLTTGSPALADKINHDEFLLQADEFHQFSDNSAWNKFLMYYELIQTDHPFTSDRAQDIVRWCASPDFANLCAGAAYAPQGYAQGGAQGFAPGGANGAAQGYPQAVCPNCGTPVDPSGAFCPGCGHPLGGNGGPGAGSAPGGSQGTGKISEAVSKFWNKI